MTAKKTFAQNTLILFVSMMICKVVGALFKIPLTNLLGGVGMGYYSAAYSIFTPVFAVTAAGIPTVIVKATAKNISRCNYANARKVLKTAVITFGVAGIAGTSVIFAAAVPFAGFVVQSPESALAIFAIAPSVFLCCLSSVYKGYYEGVCNMMPSAVSQTAEAISRVAAGLCFAYLIIFHGMECFENGMPVYGISADTPDKAMSIITPYAAAGAVAAVTLSEAVGLICLIVRHKLCKDCFCGHTGVGRVQSCREISKSLIKDTIPIALGSVVINLSSFIDMVTINRCINWSVSLHPVYYMTKFSGIMTAQGGGVRPGNFMYGSYTGIAGTMFMLIPSLTGMLGRSALPEIAGAWSAEDMPVFKRKLGMVLKSNFILGFPLYLGMAAMCSPVLEILYASRPDEADICVLPLFILCIGGVFLTLSSTLFSVFQVIGRPDLPVKLMLMSAAIKTVLNVFLISIPEINLSGAAISTSVSYAVAAFGGYIALENVTNTDYRIIPLMLPPLFSGICCAAAAGISVNLLCGYCGKVLAVCFSVIIGAVFYTLLLIITGGIHPKYLLNRQKRKK